MAMEIWRKLDTQTAQRPILTGLVQRERAPSPSPMMAMTTNNSMSVKARVCRPAEPRCRWVWLCFMVLSFSESLTVSSFTASKPMLATIHVLADFRLAVNTIFDNY